MRFAARSVASGPRTGIPPPTAASKRRTAPVRRAMASSSAPWWATTCLFAVTTLLPIASAAAMSVWAGSSPPISSTTTSISGSATRWAGASETIERREAGRDRAIDVADRDRAQGSSAAAVGGPPARPAARAGRR